MTDLSHRTNVNKSNKFWACLIYRSPLRPLKGLQGICKVEFPTTHRNSPACIPVRLLCSGQAVARVDGTADGTRTVLGKQRLRDFPVKMDRL
jgi:hypothetical protein